MLYVMVNSNFEIIEIYFSALTKFLDHDYLVLVKDLSMTSDKFPITVNNQTSEY